MISLSSDLQIRYDGGDHLENCMFNRLVLSAYGLRLTACGIFLLTAFGIFWTEEVIFNVILIIRFRFEFQLQDDRHLENIFRFDLFHAGAVVSIGILI